MNLALAGIVLLALISPGMVFRRMYYSGEFSKQFFKSSFSEQIYHSMAGSLLLHLLVIPFTLFTDYRIDVRALGLLISGTTNIEKLESVFLNIEHHSQPIILYFIAVLILGALLGKVFKSIVRYFSLDRKYPLLRFKNEWHYIASGEYLDYEGVPDDSAEVDFTYVDALIDTGDGTVIYSGVLNHYILSDEHGLDRIYLSEVRRRFIRQDNWGAAKQTEGAEDEHSNFGSWYPVKGQIMVIPFDKVINLNFTYYQIENN